MSISELAHDDPVDLWRVAVIIGIWFHHNLLVGQELSDDPRAHAVDRCFGISDDFVRQEVVRVSWTVGGERQEVAEEGEIVQQREHNRAVVCRLHAVDVGDNVARRITLEREYTLELFDVHRCSQFGAVTEHHAITQPQRVGEAVVADLRQFGDTCLEIGRPGRE